MHRWVITELKFCAVMTCLWVLIFPLLGFFSVGDAFVGAMVANAANFVICAFWPRWRWVNPGKGHRDADAR